MVLENSEVAASIITPHFDAVRDVFAEFCPAPAEPLDKLFRCRLVIDPAMHDTPRHYAACRDDGMQVLVAPEAADLPSGTLIAILVHELGHAADFAYPGRWLFTSRSEPAQWIVEPGSKIGHKARKLWHDRDDDQIEWTADAVALAVTGKKIGYCGRCMIQCFEGGIPRPRGLR